MNGLMGVNRPRQ